MAVRDMLRRWPGARARPSPPAPRCRGPTAPLTSRPMPDTTTVDAETVDLRAHIRGIPDFPKPGILFYDISTLLRHGPAWAAAMSRLGRAIRPHRPDLLAGIESRGFLIAAPLALELGLGFIMLRKRGKLPGRSEEHTSELQSRQYL